MKKVSTIFVIILILSACVSTEVPKFEPINTNGIEVRMKEGIKGAEIRNNDFYLAVTPLERDMNGSVQFTIVLFNYTDTYLPIRYTDFKLYYTKESENKVYASCLTPKEWEDYGFVDHYRRETLRTLSYEWYFKENDVRPVAFHPNGNNVSGLIAFPYDNYESFKLGVTIFGKEYLIEFAKINN